MNNYLYRYSIISLHLKRIRYILNYKRDFHKNYVPLSVQASAPASAAVAPITGPVPTLALPAQQGLVMHYRFLLKMFR
jgi:hypothetical protein